MWLSTPEIAAQTDSSEVTAARWIVKGLKLPNGRRIRLQAIRAGGRWKVRPEWLATFIGVLSAANCPQEPADEMVPAVA